ncbi:winged helix-turn-helix transcriptional regulator [Bradyrhizobium sp. AZCC 1577]|uniref:winged helix-turn-helix transcriptional regulator n=1 Tax=Bradyrhizobium sp. AZCC 1577 TaxID=3117019 RepID=UPI003FA58126
MAVSVPIFRQETVLNPAQSLKRQVQQKKSAVQASKPQSAPRERKCSVARTVVILSDAWTFLVIREAFFGARRFEEFRTMLEIPRATLTDRLQRLVAEDIFRRIEYSEKSSWVEYRLTRSGMDLYPTFMSLMQFGDNWLSEKHGVPLQLIHTQCDQVTKPYVGCSHCREKVVARRVSYRDGAGAGSVMAEPMKRSRRSSDDNQFNRGRPSSVSRALQVIGDRWSFLVIREAFFGARRFDKLQSELGIAPNILSDRLSRLVDRGIFMKRMYQSGPDRFEYLLTPMGFDLYGPLIMMMAWGDKWRSNGKAPLVLTHLDCGHDFTPMVLCSECREPIAAHSMQYRMRYNPDRFGGKKSSRALPG